MSDAGTDSERELARALARLDRLQHQNDALADRLLEAEQDLAKAHYARPELIAREARFMTENALEAGRARIEELERQLAVLLSSESWRLTAPLRVAGQRARYVAALTNAVLRATAAAAVRRLGATRLARRVARHVSPLLPPRVRGYVRRLLVAAGQRAPTRSGGIRRIFAPERRAETQGAHSAAIQARYERWRERYDSDAEELRRQRQGAADLTVQALISIVVPVFDPPVEILRETIESILGQTYPRLELCIANAGSDGACAALLDEFARGDSRVRYVRLEENAGIGANTNAALELATGDFVAFVDHDDLITPDALYRVAELLCENPEVDVIYSDEDRLSVDGRRVLPFFKPEWSPEFLHSFMWVGHLCVFRLELLDRIGHFRSEFDGSQDYDLMLRAAEATERFAHIPRVLYHWRMIPGSAAAGGKPDARRTNLAALQAAVDRSGRHGRVAEYPWANRVVFDLVERPLVSIIVPTDDVENARACVNGVLANTTYDAFEIVVVTNSGVAGVLTQELDQLLPVRVVAYDGPFNFSLKCNMGARAAAGTYLLFLNDDVVPITDGWIEAMLEYAQHPEIGGVSAKLLYDDDSIQYAGLVAGVPGVVGTAFHMWSRTDTSYNGMALGVRNVSCLTGACMLVPTDLFWDVGGWDELNTPISHSDFDLSYRLIEAGFRLVYQPFAELRHLGHVSRGRAVADDGSVVRRADGGADTYLLHRWAERIAEDPYYPRGMRHLLYENDVDYEVLAARKIELDDQWVFRPRVLLVAHELSLSGAPMMLVEVANALRDHGMLVVIATPRGGPLVERCLSGGIPVVVDGDIMERPESSERFLRGFDVIGANTVLNWRVVRAAENIGRRSVWLVQESRFGIDLVEADGRGARETFSCADRIVFPSQRTAELYERYGDVSRHVAIHYGISDVRAEIADRPHAERQSDALHIVSVGSLEPRKAAHVLLDAVERLAPATRDGLSIRFVGRTLNEDYADKLRARALNLPVEFVGEMSREEGLMLVRDSDVFVSTSLDESGPLVVIEAMALGKPVISTAVGAAAEVITSGVDGELFAPGDAKTLAVRIERMAGDADYRRALGEQARRRFEEYLTSGRYGADIVEVFEGVLPRSSSNPRASAAAASTV